MSFDMNTMNEYPQAFNSQGSAVPLKSKVKVVPGITNVQGSIYLEEKLETLVWETQFKVRVEHVSKISVMSGKRWEDLFAIWYLLAQPAQDIKPKHPFGLKRQFSGLGLFIYKKDDDAYMQIMQDMGTGMAWNNFPNGLQLGVNGCQIPIELLDNEFTVSLHSQQSALLDVYIGTKVRNMSTCVKGFFSEVLHNKGYLGVSARNSAESVKSLDLNVVKILNKDPNAYRDDSRDLQNQASTQAEEPDQLYTDELQDEAVDILEKYQSEQAREADFVKQNMGNIGPTDGYNAKLYKMIGQIKHVNSRLADFLKHEESTGRILRGTKHLPGVFRTFEEIPEKLESQAQLVSMIDVQLKEVQTKFNEISSKAVDIMGRSVDQG